MAEKKTVVPAPRLKALYQGTYLKELQAELNLKNVHEVPALEKIVVSVGTGKKKDDKRHFEIVKNTVEKITGQAPVARRRQNQSRHLAFVKVWARQLVLA